MPTKKSGVPDKEKQRTGARGDGVGCVVSEVATGEVDELIESARSLGNSCWVGVGMSRNV